MTDNSDVLDEKTYEINGKRYILRPMTLAKEVAYLATLDYGRRDLGETLDESNALTMMQRIAARVPEILAIVLNPAEPTSIEILREEIANFPPVKLEEIVTDFFAFNPSWAVGEVSQRVTKILGIVMGRPQIPSPETGDTPSSGS